MCFLAVCVRVEGCEGRGLLTSAPLRADRKHMVACSIAVGMYQSAPLDAHGSSPFVPLCVHVHVCLCVDGPSVCEPGSG